MIWQNLCQKKNGGGGLTPSPLNAMLCVDYLSVLSHLSNQPKNSRCHKRAF